MEMRMKPPVSGLVTSGGFWGNLCLELTVTRLVCLPYSKSTSLLSLSCRAPKDVLNNVRQNVVIDSRLCSSLGLKTLVHEMFPVEDDTLGLYSGYSYVSGCQERASNYIHVYARVGGYTKINCKVLNWKRSRGMSQRGLVLLQPLSYMPTGKNFDHETDSVGSSVCPSCWGLGLCPCRCTGSVQLPRHLAIQAADPVMCVQDAQHVSWAGPPRSRSFPP